VEGTLSVMRACQRTESVKQVIITSSMAAVWGAITLQPGEKWNESIWSNEESLTEKSIWYSLSKTVAERSAYEFMENEDVHFTLATVNPTFIFGPQLQDSLNTSTDVLIKYVNGTKEKIPNGSLSVVDVRDTSAAHILVHTQNSTGRHLCVESLPTHLEVCDKLRELYPDLPIPSIEERQEGEEQKRSNDVDTSKLRNIGWNPMPWEQCVKDSIDCAIVKGFIKVELIHLL